MQPRDVKAGIIIGGLVGILAQPVLANVITQLQDAAHLAPTVLRIGFFLFFLILAPVALWIANLIGKKIAVIYQFAKFAAVGSLNSFVDLGIFNLETLVLGFLPNGWLFAVLKSISFLSATTNSFFWNKYWTFESKTKAQSTEVFSFYAIAIAGFFINVGVATFVNSLSHGSIPDNIWTNLIAPVVGIFSTLFWNFAGYKFFVFKKPADTAKMG